MLQDFVVRAASDHTDERPVQNIRRDIPGHATGDSTAGHGGHLKEGSIIH